MRKIIEDFTYHLKPKSKIIGIVVETKDKYQIILKPIEKEGIKNE